jgi:hypothetical protein
MQSDSMDRLNESNISKSGNVYTIFVTSYKYAIAINWFCSKICLICLCHQTSNLYFQKLSPDKHTRSHFFDPRIFLKITGLGNRQTRVTTKAVIYNETESVLKVPDQLHRTRLYNSNQALEKRPGTAVIYLAFT